MKVLNFFKSRLKKMVTANHDGINFLSNKWKWVSLSLILLLVGFFVYFKMSHLKVLHQNQALVEIITFNVFILAFVIEMLTKGKDEDHVKNKMRVDSMSFAFITAIIFNIVSPVVDVSFGDAPEYIPSNFFLIFMIFMYYFSFGIRNVILWFKMRREKKF